MADALFQGCGYVPDVLSLQAWLECAWKAGFDVAGADMLGNSMQGSHQWIGTTECAALLRFFGLKAQIIDFTGDSSHKCYPGVSSTCKDLPVTSAACCKLPMYHGLHKYVAGSMQTA